MSAEYAIIENQGNYYFKTPGGNYPFEHPFQIVLMIFNALSQKAFNGKVAYELGKQAMAIPITEAGKKAVEKERTPKEVEEYTNSMFHSFKMKQEAEELGKPTFYMCECGQHAYLVGPKVFEGYIFDFMDATTAVINAHEDDELSYEETQLLFVQIGTLLKLPVVGLHNQASTFPGLQFAMTGNKPSAQA